MRRNLIYVLPFMVFFLASCEKQVTDPELNTGTLNKAAGNIGINIVLNTSVSNAILKELGSFGKVLDVIPEINAVRILAKETVLPSVVSLSYVKGANPDAEVTGPPVDLVPVEDFSDGLSTWNLDAVNVTDFGFNNRTVDYDGDGVYLLILDTGLLDSWRQYFPQERIMTQYAKSFSGGGVAGINVAEQPNKWEHDQNSHGTHVTSTILGYSLYGTPVNGVAPMASVIPVKVLNQNGSGWWSVIARGVLYAAQLKENDLSGSPVVVNMSLGGGFDIILAEAIDYAISKGVIVVASAGNRGQNGMGFPGLYEPVISVAAAGYKYPFASGAWWYTTNLPEPYNPDLFVIASFSSRQLTGQDLDVTAPGEYIVGPYQLQSAKRSFYYLSGTSMSAPHVSGIVALMCQKNPALTAAQVETLLETAASARPVTGFTSSDYGAGFILADDVLALVP